MHFLGDFLTYCVGLLRTANLDFHTLRVISSETVTAMLSSTGFNAIALMVLSVCSASSNNWTPWCLSQIPALWSFPDDAIKCFVTLKERQRYFLSRYYYLIPNIHTCLMQRETEIFFERYYYLIPNTCLMQK